MQMVVKELPHHCSWNLVCILTLARCGKSDSGDYPATIMVNGTNYYSTDHAVPVEVDESVIQYTTSYAENGYILS